MKAAVFLFIALVGFATAGPLQGRGRLYFPEEEDPNRIEYFYWEDDEGLVHREDLVGAVNERKADISDVTIYLYTKSNPSAPETIKPADFSTMTSSKYYKSSRKNVVITHGWKNSHESPVNTLIRSALLKKHDVNVFVVDWHEPASKNYISAHGSVRDVGTIVGNFINKLMTQYGLTGKNFNLIGHSLGAHISGCAGAAMKTKADYIIGLDPALPLFSMGNTDNRIDPSDAQFVQIIHTNAGLLGFSSSIGHADYYPNGGKKQIGCGADLTGTCSHSRSYMYLAESIQNSGFTSHLCNNFGDYDKGKCSGNHKSFLGKFTIDRTASGDYFLATKEKEPFSLG
ncbi:PREDICTED: pancreatic lipase-related protein 2-like [Nicrophorus vespilloides]|uniref:Pancreatic lipase-related protein 2-like n=1 Tax=Nicrophorus vespilloides TaxID=110193 RepID=A0ABM1NKE1_NICVS|nr:PREDICTED: pancreatic lipase-related protein 2-like [Nicrophorus vespilloides]